MQNSTKTTDYTIANKPRRINWKVVAGPEELGWLQKEDTIFDTQDLNDRFPPRNYKLLKDAGLLSVEDEQQFLDRGQKL